MFFRIQQPEHPVEWLLDPERQCSTSWGVETVRAGVSVCAGLDGLASYLARVGIPVSDGCRIVELDGYEADEDDEDAALGALLIIPTRIVSDQPVGDEFYQMISDAYDDALTGEER